MYELLCLYSTDRFDLYIALPSFGEPGITPKSPVVNPSGIL
jgi:hypothetical protein